MNLPAQRSRLVATTTAAAVTAAATATATMTAAATAAIFTRPRFVHGQRASIHVFAIHGRNGSVSFRCILHFDESESFGSIRHPVHDHLSGQDRSMRLKHTFEFAVGNLIR
jgi:hypothetical protein